MDQDDPSRDGVRELLGLGPRRLEPLRDEQGPIPVFPPRRFDEHGHLIPIADEERRARAEAFRRTLEAMRNRPDDDPPDTMQRMMRGIDAHRTRKLFGGYS